MKQRTKHPHPNSSYTFNSKPSYSNHLTTHHNQNFQCPYKKCSLHFKSLSLLKRHLTSHSKHQKHLCPLCNKSFSSEHNMHVHYNRHSIINKKTKHNTQLQNDIHKCTMLIRNSFKAVLKKYSLVKNIYK